MTDTKLITEEIVRLGEERYEREVRALVEPQHNGEFLVLDVDTGEYEMDRDEAAAFQRAISAHPHGRLFLKRVGFAAAHRIGGRLRVTRP